MNKFIILSVCLSLLFSQNTLTDEEIVNIANKITELETTDKLKSDQIFKLEQLLLKYKEQSKIDSSLILSYEQKISIIKDQNKMLEEQVKLIKPKWYENKYLWFGFGVIFTAGSVHLAGQIK